ncbi:hypothetical protein BU24DRAFT_118802 [Aaosphaeria arxii CBS 175.79]|uniref:Uncharacterized protein n=1 Tax=Aaosphaeria arxii CBS 175.79 TaxID=1450172 RepID=A0A6A5Y1N1_9PLEO|nr:uncharacterized protein BU24DRAFT_118802 [Aaosphaeria arxii CBS 175.79]KAF2019382.1 hypothetical protein BU24DRAFT_118802 [Aaosphaeria arxii CBS 175.79]
MVLCWATQWGNAFSRASITLGLSALSLFRPVISLSGCMAKDLHILFLFQKGFSGGGVDAYLGMGFFFPSFFFSSGIQNSKEGARAVGGTFVYRCLSVKCWRSRLLKLYFAFLILLLFLDGWMDGAWNERPNESNDKKDSGSPVVVLILVNGPPVRLPGGRGGYTLLEEGLLYCCVKRLQNSSRKRDNMRME